MRLLQIVIISLLFFSSCKVFTESHETPALGDIHWQLIAMDQKAVSLGDNAYIKFNDKDLKAAGKVACNSFFADYEILAGDKINFGPIGSTKMYCEGLMDQENQIISDLQKVRRYEIKYGLLYLFGEDLLLTFKKVNVDN